MPFNLGFGELVIVLVIVLVLFGAKRIPEISASFGKGIREFKKNVNDVERQVTEPDRSEPRLRGSDPLDTPRSTNEEVRPEPKRLI
jgi:sec-independent protein translocase protein TatA